MVYEVWATNNPLPASFKRFGRFDSLEEAEEFRESIKFLPNIASTKLKTISKAY